MQRPCPKDCCSERYPDRLSLAGGNGDISGRDSHHHGYPTKLVLGQRASWRGVEPESRVSKRKEEVNSKGFTGQYISTNETTHRIIHSPHKAPPTPRPSVAQPSRYSLRLCLLPLIPRLPTARCVQLRTRATTHSPSRIVVTGQPRAPGGRGGLLLKALRLGQWQEAQAWAAAQTLHNLSRELSGYGTAFSIGRAKGRSCPV